jgi:ligand-binding SRPBCC domain-containing protein
MDEQRRGPSRLWKHGHRFSEQAGGTEVVDPVHYAVWGESLVNLFVALGWARYLDYRSRILTDLFQATSPG